jgi:hypothetical protein
LRDAVDAPKRRKNHRLEKVFSFVARNLSGFLIIGDDRLENLGSVIGESGLVIGAPPLALLERAV